MGQFGMLDGGGIAGAGLDAEAEQVGQPADVAGGGAGFVEDAVLTDRGDGQCRIRTKDRTCRTLPPPYASRSCHQGTHK
jgi:hypothetical protein